MVKYGCLMQKMKKKIYGIFTSVYTITQVGEFVQ